MSGVRRFDHVGVVVDDLDLVAGFFVDLGFERGDPMRVEGGWVDRIVGLDGVRADMVPVNAPDGGGWLELTRFHRPVDPAPAQGPQANRLGFRHVACVVDDLDGVLERLRDKGWGTVGDVVDHENAFRLCYVGGPEGLIVELAERVEAAA
ncbi:VOC family protein [Actinokineospora spheciospongiae]|uniref:VOC family protein n=1 Tax=Actinokineospora spheciospongiae TaxID=909613 RepID=UPI000D70938E|nr:VOC family protein [Actinokineospora spheciospongiae]PWW66489.1 glyoxalase/bleomycin resistance protein/dioxygenase superfamily protein [Actinokineospora spheciospongiae]